MLVKFEVVFRDSFLPLVEQGSDTNNHRRILAAIRLAEKHSRSRILTKSKLILRLPPSAFSVPSVWE